MSNVLNLIDKEETTIVCNYPNGQRLEVDAFDVDYALQEVYTTRGNPDKLHYTKQVLPEMCKWFEERYGFPISHLSMDKLLGVKILKLNSLKKNSLTQLEVPNTTESSLPPNSNSESSD